mmetsp:Transcript_29907/g.102977  ORF Transcript_29907/g.102977 Transcript_29907/m.102977 type:complete len:400 (-) Transcript_29907:837-2036(-)
MKWPDEVRIITSYRRRTSKTTSSLCRNLSPRPKKTASKRTPLASENSAKWIRSSSPPTRRPRSFWESAVSTRHKHRTTRPSATFAGKRTLSTYTASWKRVKLQRPRGRRSTRFPTSTASSRSPARPLWTLSTLWARHRAGRQTSASLQTQPNRSGRPFLYAPTSCEADDWNLKTRFRKPVGQAAATPRTEITRPASAGDSWTKRRSTSSASSESASTTRAHIPGAPRSPSASPGAPPETTSTNRRCPCLSRTHRLTTSSQSRSRRTWRTARPSSRPWAASLLVPARRARRRSTRGSQSKRSSITAATTLSPAPTATALKRAGWPPSVSSSRTSRRRSAQCFTASTSPPSHPGTRASTPAGKRTTAASRATVPAWTLRSTARSPRPTCSTACPTASPRSF